MAHELTIRKNGKAEIMYVGDAPWHNLGTKVEGVPTIEEAIKAAGLDWTVNLKPLFLGTEGDDQTMALDESQKVPAKATVRSDNNNVLGVVGLNYRPLQNIEAFKFFQTFLDSKAATLETAGSLKGGKRVWILAKIAIPAQEVVPGDKVEQYVLLSNSHDGTTAIRVGFTAIRVVCNNTLSVAEMPGVSKLISIKHVGNPAETLEAIKEIMDLAGRQFTATVEQYRKLAAMPVSIIDLEKYVRIAFNLKEEDSDGRSSKVVQAVTRLFQTGRGAEMDGVKGTMWAAYNAATEYIQYERGKSEDTRLDSTWFGDGAAINKRAFLTAVEMAEKVAA